MSLWELIQERSLQGSLQITQVLTLGTQLKQGHLNAIQGEQGQLGSSWVIPGEPKVQPEVI